MKKAIALFLIIVGSGAFFIFYVSGEQSVLEEKLTYVSEDENADFVHYDTRLQLINKVDKDEYTIKWRLASKLDRSAYWRQDLSLLYEDGRLIEKLSISGENTRRLEQTKKINREDNGHFQAISVHHAEIHYPNGKVTTQQKMSYDQLYVTASPLGPMEAFEIPKTEEEKEWQKIMNHATKQQLHYAWKDLLKQYHIRSKRFYHFSLPYLHVYNRNKLPGMTEQQTEKAIGKLWEKLYKHYFHGIKTEGGEVVNPIGSTVPLVLLNKDGSRFVVLTKTAAGESVKLVQPLDEINH